SSCAAATTGRCGAATLCARISPRRGTSMRKVLAVPPAHCVLLAASGWLYLARPHVGGRPLVGDALPLDELSRHSALPLWIFLAVWGTAALLLGALMRWARVERLTAALLLAAAIGAWTYAATGVSLLVVRQVPARDAFHAVT